MAFPTDLDSYTTINASDKTNSPSLAGTLNSHADSIEAVQAKVGVDSSAVTTSHDYKLANPTTENNVGVKEKDSGGTARNMIKVNASDQLVIGDSNLDETLLYTTAKMRAYLSADQLNLVDGVSTLVQLDTEIADPGSNFDVATYLFTAPVSGTYAVSACIRYINTVVDKLYYVEFKVSGTRYSINSESSGSSATAPYVAHHDEIIMTAGQTLGLYAISASGTNTVDVAGGSVSETWMSVHLLSAT